MNITVTFRHMDSSNPLKDYVEQKFSKIAKYLFEPIDAHVVLEVEKKIRQIAEITLSAKDYHTHMVEEAEDMYAAIDVLLDKLERNVRRHKERVKDHKVDQRAAEAAAAASS